MKLRDAVRTLAVAPLAAAFRWTPESVRDASARAREALACGTTYEPKAFTAHEWETVRVLVDLIIPKDERSGSATEAGVPEFMDFMLGDDPELQTPVRGGLARLDQSEEHTSELQSQSNLVCRLLLEKKKKNEDKKQTSVYKDTKNVLHDHN